MTQAKMHLRVKTPREFGDSLRKLRLDRKISQASLGGNIGVLQQTVARWESGERSIPPVETCKLLADLLANGSLDQLCLVER